MSKEVGLTHKEESADWVLKKGTMSIRLSPHGRQLLYTLAQQLGIGPGGVIELALRKFAKEEGVAQ
jgi:hypothetical protein